MSRDLLIAPSWIGRSGLWLTDAKGARREADAEDIGLSEDLADRLEAWMDLFDSIYDEDDEPASAFASPADEQAWLAEGEAVAAAIASELGPAWTVERDLLGWQGKTKA